MSNTMTPTVVAAFCCAARRANWLGTISKFFGGTLDYGFLVTGGYIARQWSGHSGTNRNCGRGEAALLRHITNRNHRGVALVAAHLQTF